MENTRLDGLTDELWQYLREKLCHIVYNLSEKIEVGARFVKLWVKPLALTLAFHVGAGLWPSCCT